MKVLPKLFSHGYDILGNRLQCPSKTSMLMANFLANLMGLSLKGGDNSMFLILLKDLCSHILLSSSHRDTNQILFVCLFEAGSLYVLLASLEFTVKPRLALNS